MDGIITFLVASSIIAVYFFLKKFDTKKEKKAKQPIEPNNPIKPNNTVAQTKELKFFCIKDNGYNVSVWPKDKDEFDIVRFNIAGITHYKQTAMQHLGETMGFLAAEPDNPYDENAIKIVTPTWEAVGYVPRDMTDEVRKHATLPCPCLFYIGYYTDSDGIHFYTDAYIDLKYIKK